ncbi:MAG: response regulator transcription factor [Chromatiales bacterium]|nr:response regulator transcription factor [Chromatiales bacterium]
MTAEGPAEGSGARFRVILVEDDPDTRHYLAEAIRGQVALDLMAACPDLQSGRVALAAGPPDVLLTDLALPDGDGVDLIREYKQASPHCECMVISVFGSEARVVAAIEAGATGYLLKDEPVERVGEAILSLVQGGSPMSPGIARHILNRLNPAAPSGHQPVNLTERELAVLSALARGFTYSEISAQFGLSTHTVATHIKNIYRKLEVSSRAEAVFEACQMGIIRL